MRIKITKQTEGLAKLIYNDGVLPEEEMVLNKLYDLEDQSFFKIEKVSPIFSKDFDSFKYVAEQEGVLSNESEVLISFPPLPASAEIDLIDELITIDQANDPDAKAINVLALIPIENYFDRIVVANSLTNGFMRKTLKGDATIYDVQYGDEILLTKTAALFYEAYNYFNSDTFDIFEFQKSTEEIVFPDIHKIKYKVIAFFNITLISFSIDSDNNIEAEIIVKAKEDKSFVLSVSVDIPNMLDDAANQIKLNEEAPIIADGVSSFSATAEEKGEFQILLTGKINATRSTSLEGLISISLETVDGGNVALIDPANSSVEMTFNYNLNL